MKKGIITILILLLSTASIFAQLQGFGTYRIANATTPFGLNVAKGSAIFDINSGDVYVLKKDEKSTATLSGMVLGTDYINLQLWEGHQFANYLNQPVLTSSSPRFNGLTTGGNIMPALTNNYDIGSSSNYFYHVFTNNLYAYGTSFLNGNVNVGVNLDVTGTAIASDFILSSDSTLKHDIEPIEVNVSSIPLIQFKFKADTTNRERYGVIAQSLQKVAPTMVYTGLDGKLKVAYIGFLIARMANDESRIDSLKTVISHQQIVLNDLLKRVKKLEDEK